MKKSKEPPLLKSLIIILNLIIYAWVAVILYNTFKTTENPPEGQIERENSEIMLVQGVAIKASTPPVHIKPQTYAIITNGLTDNQSQLLEKLWFCEASYRHEGVWGDCKSGHCKAYGAFQFWQPTWNHYCEGSRYDFNDQVKCAEYMIFELGIGHRHWVNCFRKMGLNKYIN